jgi:RND family efflux transporter MFP subunit
MDDKTKLLESLQIRREPESPAAASAGSSAGWWVAGALGVALLVVAGWSWTNSRKASVGAEVIETADASTSTNSAITDTSGSVTVPASAATLDASGYVVARRTATVSATIPGRVTEVLISEGSEVKEGQVLAHLDDSSYQLALLQARANLDSSEVQLQAANVALANAEPTYERVKKQRAAGYLSAQDLDTAKANFDTAKSTVDVQQEAVKVAQSAVAIAERNIKETIIRAPFNGVITQKNAQPGEIVSPGAAGGSIRTGIGTIVDMDSLEVEVDVSENYINRVKPGQKAAVKLNAYPDWEIPAKVIAIIPTADRAKATVKVRIGFEQRDARILPDMGAHVAFFGG